MKKIISATIDSDLIKWLDAFSKSSTKFRNKSHVIEVAIEVLKEIECGERKKK